MPAAGQPTAFDPVARHLERHLEEHVERLRRWVSRPTVSLAGDDLAAMARWAADELAALGCGEVEVIPGRHHPGVFAFYDAGATWTLHTYGMLDTSPADAASWSCDPWAAELVARDGFSRVLMGRGALHAKGPFVAFLNALDAMVAVRGTLPVNVAFLLEGEELLGSPSYPSFVERFAERMADVRLSYCPTPAQGADGTLALGLGLKGMALFELVADGAAMVAGPRRPLRASLAGLVRSPTVRLAHALAALVEDDGRTCAVPELAPGSSHHSGPTPAARERLAALTERYGESDWRQVLPFGGPAAIAELAVADPLEELLYGTSCNVAGVRAGFLGADSGTSPFTVPASASAWVDLRSVTDLGPAEVLACVRRHLRARGFPDIELRSWSAFHHHQPRDGDGIAAAAEAAATATARAHGFESVVWPMQPGGGAWSEMPNRFGVPCLRGGVPGGGRGGDDEYLVIDGDERCAGLLEMEWFHVDLLDAVAAAVDRASGLSDGSTGAAKGL